MNDLKKEYDYVIIGSGFGGSVSALRLAEKGYSVLVIEKGKHFAQQDFPKSNWNLRRWLWLPGLRFFGFFKLTFFRHIGVLSGVGVGGGSLVYANTLPRPDSAFFTSGNWNGIRDWEKELEPFYTEAEKMLGVNINPKLYDSDLTLQLLSQRIVMNHEVVPTHVGVFFGEPEKEVPDPYFNGDGPTRSGCTFCGGCMTGCRYNAKNTLDKNYLYLAQKKGVQILAEHRVTKIHPAGNRNGSEGYDITFKKSTSFLFARAKKVKAHGVVIAGGVLGTVRLLLDMKNNGMPQLSNEVGNHIRTNNESLVLVTSGDKKKDMSKGIAIGTIVKADEHSHLEAVRYGSGSGFWKILGAPLTHGKSMLNRIGKLGLLLITRPFSWLSIYFTRDFAKESVILLFMQHLDSALRFRRGLISLKSSVTSGKAPTAFVPFAKKLAETAAEITGGKPFVLITEAVTGIPTTAHILGGAVIGDSPQNGVIDVEHKVFGYQNMYVCDGSAISANPGVNPSLTITAMSERAMSKIPDKMKLSGG